MFYISIGGLLHFYTECVTFLHRWSYISIINVLLTDPFIETLYFSLYCTAFQHPAQNASTQKHDLDWNTFSLKVNNQLTFKVTLIICCPELKTSLKSHLSPWHLMPVAFDKMKKEPQTPKLGQIFYLPNMLCE